MGPANEIDSLSGFLEGNLKNDGDMFLLNLYLRVLRNLRIL